MSWVSPRLGAMLVVDIGTVGIVPMLRAAGARGSAAVKILHAATRMLFEHPCGALIRPDNLAVGIKRASVVEVKPARKGTRWPAMSLRDSCA